MYNRDIISMIGVEIKYDIQIGQATKKPGMIGSTEGILIWEIWYYKMD